MNDNTHTGLDEATFVASNTMQAVRTGKAISAAAKGAAAGGRIAERPEQPGSRSLTIMRPLRKI